MEKRISESRQILSVVLVVAFIDFVSSINGTTQRTFIARSLEDFGNPTTDFAACGRNGKMSYICDPDQVLTVGEGDLLDLQIKEILRSTCCPCPGQSSGYLIAMALLNKMKLTNSSDDSSIPNQNDEQGWHLNSVLAEAKHLATGLLKKWNLGSCGESVLILFSRSDNVLYTVADSVAGRLLTNDLIGEIAMDIRSELGQNITTGFSKLLGEYRSVFNGSYVRKTNWKDVNMPTAFPVMDTGGNSLNTYVYFYTLATVIVTILMQL